MEKNNNRSSRSVTLVQEYWNSRPLGKQYIRDESIEIGSHKFYDHVRP